MVATESMINGVKKQCSILEKIAQTIAEITTINPLECLSSRGSAQESFVKQLFFYLASNNTRHSLDYIGEYITGATNKNSAHCIVSYSKKKIEQIIYKTERKRIMDDKHYYDIIIRCSNKLIYDGMPVHGNISPELLAKYYEGVAQF
jgi:chromosomal replication initiation ATPase DnaA